MIEELTKAYEGKYLEDVREMTTQQKLLRTQERETSNDAYYDTPLFFIDGLQLNWGVAFKPTQKHQEIQQVGTYFEYGCFHSGYTLHHYFFGFILLHFLNCCVEGTLHPSSRNHNEFAKGQKQDLAKYTKVREIVVK